MSDELVERVAAILAPNSREWSETRRKAMRDARAIIPLVLEHAAKVAEDAEAPFDEHRDCQMCHGFDVATAQIAAAIRQVQP